MNGRTERPNRGPTKKGILSAFVGSTVAIPLIVGLLTRSYLFAAVAFCIWTALFTTVFGIVFSSRQANMHRPAHEVAAITIRTGHPISGSTPPVRPDHLPNGWVLPAHVTLRSDPTFDLASNVGRQVLLAALMAFGLALVAAALAFSAEGTFSLTATVVGLLSSWTAVYDLIILGISRRSVRAGMPRPSLDRPSALIGVFIPAALLGVFAACGAFGNSGWGTQVVIALIVLLASMAANGWWFAKSAQRWNLIYEVVRK